MLRPPGDDRDRGDRQQALPSAANSAGTNDRAHRVRRSSRQLSQRDGKRDTTRRDIAILDVLDQTAVVKLTASWGIDYMFLGKYDGEWKITQILWQSHPPRT